MAGGKMVESQKVIMLDIKLYDEDISNFISVIEKLLTLSSRPGFVKQFSVNERACIENIAQSIGLDIPEQFHVNANIDTVKF
jgi:hypothetical protein